MVSFEQLFFRLFVLAKFANHGAKGRMSASVSKSSGEVRGEVSRARERGSATLCHSHPFPVPPCTRNPPIHPHNAPLAIRYPPDIRPRPLPGLIFSNIRPRSVTNWISTCGLNRFATCSLRSAECHGVKPTANLVCVISEVTGAQLVTAAQHILRRVGSLP